MEREISGLASRDSFQAVHCPCAVRHGLLLRGVSPCYGQRREVSPYRTVGAGFLKSSGHPVHCGAVRRRLPALRAASPDASWRDRRSSGRRINPAMANQSGSVYGLTILSPIIDDDKATPSHDLQIRKYLAALSTREESPFALAPGTHLARLVVMDDVIFVGSPVHEEHLNSKYLIFEANIDGDLDSYLGGLAAAV